MHHGETSDESSDRLLTLDIETLGQNGYLTPKTMRGWLGEQYRILKRPILKQAQRGVRDGVEMSRVVTVTSALPGEGKTFTVMNLATSIAMEMDVSVLVIDADLMERALTLRMQLDGRLGLSDLILDQQLDPRTLMLKVNLGRYSILPAGASIEHPGELVSSGRMRDVIHAVVEDYRDSIILIDTPPLLTTGQAAVLSDLAGQVLVVVEEGRTPEQAVKDAISIIADKESVGLVLNKSGGASRHNYWPYYGSP